MRREVTEIVRVVLGINVQERRKRTKNEIVG